jgi:hypothetical protein
MAYSIVERGDGVRTDFSVPVNPGTPTVTVDGSAVTPTSVSQLGVIKLPSAPAAGAQVVIKYETPFKAPAASQAGILLAQNIPQVLMGAGTFNTSGLLTLTTQNSGMPSTIKARAYFTASNGLAAGWYTGTFLTTSTFQIDGSPTTTAGAYTPSLSQEVIFASVVIPGGSLGATSGALNVTADIRSNASATSQKNFGVRLGGTSLFLGVAGATTSSNLGLGSATLRCRGSLQSTFVTTDVATGGTPSKSNMHQDRDMSTDKTLEVYGSLGSGGDSIWLNSILVQLTA